MTKSKYENFYGVTNICPHLSAKVDENKTVFVYGKTEQECYEYLDRYLHINNIIKDVWIYHVGFRPHKPIPTSVYIMEITFTNEEELVMCSYLYKKGEKKNV